MKQNPSFRVTVCGFLLFLFGLQLNSMANTMTCRNPDPNAPGNLSPGNNCMATIDISTTLTSTTCTGPFVLVVKTLAGDTIAWDTALVQADMSIYIGDTIVITTLDLPTGVNCDSYYFVTDKQKPTFVQCPWDTVGVTHPLDPAHLPEVIATDNCSDSISYKYLDVSFGPSCSNPIPEFVGALVRTWTATDASGNEKNCQQTIFILKPSVDSVVFPADYLIDCASGTPADPTLTGVPTLDGFPIQVGGFQTLTATNTDLDTIPGTGGHPIIVRQWTVFDSCTSQVVRDTQLIVYGDTTAPVISCVPVVVYETDTLVCHTDVVLPLPAISDDCSGWTVSVSTPPLGNTVSLNDVPKGTYTATFTVTDDAGNSATCQTTLIVEDHETPQAVCDGFKVIGLPYPDGTITLAAAAFDDGSHDNCSPVAFEVSRDGGTTFTPSVTFTCDDLFDTIMVILKVYETANPASMNFCMNTVVLQDKLAPVFTFCPPNTTIDCGTDYSDLSIFGEPSVTDNCNATVVPGVVFNINSTCGTGTITRTWTAFDSTGNSSQCQQIISVQNLTPYDGSDIIWPKDTAFVNLCTGPGSFHPDSLPPGYDYPQTSPTNCEMLAVNYTDQVFYFSFPIAFKIVRTWRILDWCQYDPSNPGVGIWTHQQIITSMDTQAPVFTFVPSDTTVGVNASCTFATVNLQAATATDCSPTVTITNNSPYAFSNGANASGNYPPGVHTVTFTAKDPSGNKSTASITITVADLKKPTPFCNSGIAAELQEMGGQIMVTVSAEQFNNKSFDNCTDTTDLIFTMRLLGDTIPPTPMLTFDCNDRGEHLVEVWVTDESGNSDFCTTKLIIQDNMVVCPADTLVAGSAMIAGKITSHLGDKMTQVPVELENMDMMNYTSNTGTFEFHDLTPNGSYTVKPIKNDDPANGVTTFDLVIISRHVLNVSPLDSPYKLIAADVNNSGSVTTADIVELRKLILHIYDEFPKNTSWRFVPKDYVFSNPANPFDPPFPEARYINSLSHDIYNADFVGIKIGDLNGSAVTNFNGDDPSSRSLSGELTLLADERTVQAGEVFTVPFYFDTEIDLLALQFTIEFETDDLELQGIEKGALPGEVETYWGTTRALDGVLTAGWFSLQPTPVEANSTLFSLRFKARRTVALSQALRMSSRFTTAMAYDAAELPLNLQLVYNNDSEMIHTSTFKLYQNQPNPFSKVTTIGFELPTEGFARLRIMDLSGNVLKVFENNYPSGYHEIRLLRDELPASGVLLYQLETNGFTETRKMVIVN
ncbi:MAG: hypothetical protein KatS3mg030_717 [Saprospiraceae bacterium]|nr:MAG: hypothetical protein KatS3mg030_717 [Saprospiraceae bacterium]